MAADIAAAGWLDCWLAPEHPKHEYTEPAGLPVEFVPCQPAEDVGVWRMFLSSIDVLVLVENSPIVGLVEMARQYGVMIVLIPMMEWLKVETPWISKVDMMWGPTNAAVAELRQAARMMIANGRPCPWADHIVGGRWGVNLEEFEFRQRTKADRFLFANGQGGIFGRKGAETLAAAARRCPEANVIFTTQTPEFPAMPSNVDVRLVDYDRRGDVYSEGDIFLASTYWEGLGHQLYECQAAGLPLIATDGEPMDQARAWRRIPVKRRIWQNLYGKQIVRHCPDAEAMAALMAEVSGADIRETSLAGRRFVESNYSLADTLAQLGDAIDSRFEVFEQRRRSGGGNLS